jgi:hypothetical protein
MLKRTQPPDSGVEDNNLKSGGNVRLVFPLLAVPLKVQAPFVPAAKTFLVRQGCFTLTN